MCLTRGDKENSLLQHEIKDALQLHVFRGGQQEASKDVQGLAHEMHVFL